MSAVSAMPAAVRLPRTAAARRALLAALFLGGFLALAFLFGGSAHAAERTDAGGTVDAQAASGLLDPGRADDTVARHTSDAAAAAGAAGDTGAAGDAAQVTDDAVRDAVRPVERQTRELTEPVTDLLDETGRSLPVHLPSDALGGVGGDTGTSGSVPAQRLFDGRQAKGDTAPVRSAEHTASRIGPMAPRAAAVTAPRTVADDDRAPVVRAAHGPAQGDGVPAPLHLPLPGSPVGTVSQCTGDSGAPRHGDVHAALVPGGPAGHSLRPGAIRAESSAPTRERFNEVLEFPG